MKLSIVLGFVFVLLFSSAVFSASITTVTIDSVSATTATTGTNVVVQTISTADSGTVTADVRLISSGQNTGGSLTVNDPAAGYYQNAAISSSGTTKSFTATAGTADTYTISAQATYSGGSTSSTSDAIVFVSPSAMSVSGSSTSNGTWLLGGTFTLSITVNNPQASSILTSYTLSLPSGVSASGDPTSSSAVTIGAGQTKSYQWTITIDTEVTGTRTIQFQLGDNTNAYTVSGSKTTTTTTTTTAGGGSSGGGGGGGGAGNATNATINGTTTTSATTTTTVEPGVLPHIIPGIGGTAGDILTIVIILVLVFIGGFFYYEHEHKPKWARFENKKRKYSYNVKSKSS